MNELDKQLKTILLRQVKKSRPLSDKLINDLPNPRYFNGRLMKYGDIPLHVLEIKSLNPDAVVIKVFPEYKKYPGDSVFYQSAQFSLVKEDQLSPMQLNLLVFSSDDIDEISRKYWYAGGNEDATHVIKREE